MGICRAWTKRLTALAAIGLGTIAAAPPAVDPSFVPALRRNFPDAFVLPTKSGFVAYATNDKANVPMAGSTDLIHWSTISDPTNPKAPLDAMPVMAPWAKAGFTWAPEVIVAGNRYLLYYTASSRRYDAQCVGVASADSPTGPFRDVSTEPLLCQTKLGGTIDASPFRDDDGKLYLYFKNDGNRVHARTALWVQRLSSDGMAVTGEPVQLLSDRSPWEQRVVEAPTMVRSPAGYTLFFSGGFFGWNKENDLSPYGMGYASCSSPLGPCTEAPQNPILHSFRDRQAGCLSGPGHQSIFRAAGRTFISFHAWAATSACRKSDDDARYLYIAPLFWKDGKWQIGQSLRAPEASEHR